jgi:putative ATP-dependent endonuclease of the OLD family
MIIREVRVRHFRSIEMGELAKCGDLNVLIGRNNAGKSNLLSCIELMLLHLKKGQVAGRWPRLKRKGDFTDRDDSIPVRIGVEFVLDPSMNESLRKRLVQEAPHLERSIDQIKAQTSISIILAGVSVSGQCFLFVEQMSVGELLDVGPDISTSGIKLMSVTKEVAHELFENIIATDGLSEEVDALSNLRRDNPWPIEFLRRRLRERGSGSVREWEPLRKISLDSIELLGQHAASSISDDEFSKYIGQRIDEIKEKIDKIQRKDTDGTISAFAGEIRVRPAYAEWLMKQFGGIPFLHLREAKQPIGRSEAETLLEFKVRRGGTNRLDAIQQTVKALLGVAVDVFQAEGGESRGAEMDVDEFLVETNGAGIREALRIILDIELRAPKLVLIEEPEVHLHPGLARVVASYLRDKSRDVQMFLTTHSTEFVDSSFYRNIYLISRDKNKRTTCIPVEGEDEALKIPSELGLRPSTVFMYDRLVFVEGPSDEVVFRELARKLDIDLSKANVGFVHMGGVRNFAHFAVGATLDLLSRRQIGLWFIADRDESDDEEVARMIQRLDGRANLTILRKRELENYLLNQTAIHKFIEEKRVLSGSAATVPTVEEVRDAMGRQAAALKDEVIRLRLERRLLKPVFLHTRDKTGSISDRLNASIGELKRRAESIEQDKKKLIEDLEHNWAERCFDEAPGSLILRHIAAEFGCSFNKDRGDSERLAHLLPKSAITGELVDLLTEIGSAE